MPEPIVVRIDPLPIPGQVERITPKERSAEARGFERPLPGPAESAENGAATQEAQAPRPVAPTAPQEPVVQVLLRAGMGQTPEPPEGPRHRQALADYQATARLGPIPRQGVFIDEYL